MVTWIPFMKPLFEPRETPDSLDRLPQKVSKEFDEIQKAFSQRNWKAFPSCLRNFLLFLALILIAIVSLHLLPMITEHGINYATRNQTADP
jgi:hypothetical protein